MISLNPRYGYHIKKKRRLQRITLICQECEKEYEAYPFEKNKRKYCSRICASRNYHRTVNTKIEYKKDCLYCGEEFVRVRQKSKPEPKFCCTDCSNRYHANKRKLKPLKELEVEYSVELCDV